MEAATEAVDTAGGKLGDSAQRSANPCTLLAICIGIFTVGCLASVVTLILLCSVPSSPGGYFPAEDKPRGGDNPPRNLNHGEEWWPPLQGEDDSEGGNNGGGSGRGNSGNQGENRGYRRGTRNGQGLRVPVVDRRFVGPFNTVVGFRDLATDYDNRDWRPQETTGGTFSSVGNRYYGDTEWGEGRTTGGTSLGVGEHYYGGTDWDEGRTTGGTSLSVGNRYFGDTDWDEGGHTRGASLGMGERYYGDTDWDERRTTGGASLGMGERYYRDTDWDEGRTTGGTSFDVRKNKYGELDGDHGRTTGGTSLRGPLSPYDYKPFQFFGIGGHSTSGNEQWQSATSWADTASADEEELDASDGGLDGTSSQKAPSGAIVMRKDTQPPASYSQLYYVPEVDVTVLIHGPSAQPGRYTSLYEREPERVFCFVVAGTERLGITGAGVNGAMADLLVKETTGYTTKYRLADMTESVHRVAVDNAKKHPGVLQSLHWSYQDVYETLYSFCEEDIHPLPGVEDTVGIPVLAALQNSFHIYGNAKNAYLLYVVSPKGTAPDASFRKAYTATWRNVISLVARANEKLASSGQAPIEQLRVPLLSGGIYRHQRSSETLAKIAVTELLPAARRAGPNFLLDFMFDDEESFFYAIRSTFAK